MLLWVALTKAKWRRGEILRELCQLAARRIPVEVLLQMPDFPLVMVPIGGEDGNRFGMDALLKGSGSMMV